MAMTQFEVWRTCSGERWLMGIDTRHYDPLYGFWRLIKRMED